ncbi:MAG TPA: hypothetical protein VFQ35_16035 [Polyangiaceae bacterium]|nr:hypothetical protein [Polyangiaceae bacterium]
MARLFAVVLLTLLVFGTRRAHAMSLVPMCGVNAETVVAPPISRAAQEIPLGPSACDPQSDPRLETTAPRQTPPELPSIEVVPRVPPVAFHLPREPRTRAPLVPIQDGERSAHRSALERPPRRLAAIQLA